MKKRILCVLFIVVPFLIGKSFGQGADSTAKKEHAQLSISPNSYWSGASVGASLGYNVNASGGTNNIVGGATIIINPVSVEYGSIQMAIIGNIANFISSGSNSTTNTDLSKLAQANNGLTIGFGGVRTLVWGDGNEFAFRIYANTIYQLNSFKLGSDTITHSLSQWKNTLGLEFEGFKFAQGGVMTLGIAANYGIFDPTEYQVIFGEKKSSLTSLETSIILPISNQFGFLASGTYSNSFKPVFRLGIIVKTIDFSKK